MPNPPAFDPADLPESNATSMPGPFRAGNQTRWARRLGQAAGLTNFGVNLVRIVPGGQSSHRHAHTLQDEFVMVLEGAPTLVTDAGEQVLAPGHCAGFPKGSGDGHHFLNRSDRDVVILVVGDRTPGDAVFYPDIDLAGRPDAAGGVVFTRKDGSSF